MFSYDTHVKPYSKQFKLITIEEPLIKKINEFVIELIEVKKKESHHIFDNKSHYKRCYTGMLGEVALEKYLGVTGIADWTIGESSLYHQPDLKKLGINAGVKTVEYGLFPVIFKNNYGNEVIMIRWKNRHVYLCGVAKKEVLNTCQSDDLIKCSMLRTRGTKTGFYGFSELKTFNDINDLKYISQFKQ
jgi:hypothetical protein